ncbi:hypothetical protein [Streptomyces sp. DSM 15324]|uniref:hypothetical protein n=1 Tax=Streptomyces sp. DSM 15324 TaxID=1739111 RepID=UPI0007469EFC|nr:hypothetical protein [Streptomyces sp. DSM 15324]KUO13764.1 hypothetical protein AQJ58_01375 [Streptomyces sp. DSM 15324]
MITTDSIGDWLWEIAPRHEVKPSRAIDHAVAVWNILAAAGVAIPVAEVSVGVRAGDDMRGVRFEASGLPLESVPLVPGSALASAAEQVDAVQGDTVVRVRMRCPGEWREAGVRHRVEQLFTLQVDIWDRSLLTVLLETYSDAWLTMDTRGREQLAVHEENAPRLEFALTEISKYFGCSPTPGDENRYAIPTETGFEDVRIEGPAYIDAWRTFEVLDRSRRLRSSLPDSEQEYSATTEQPVRYYTVQEGGQVLGYVWAAQGDDAAGFEPRTAAGEPAFEAGRAWLLRLRQARRQGISASQVLHWLNEQGTPAGIGHLVEDEPRNCPSLEELEDLSGRW